MKTPKAMRDYQKQWRQKHHKKYMLSVQRSTASSYIRNHASFEDLLELQLLIKERKRIIQKEGVY